jgi:hypothetical protein
MRTSPGARVNSPRGACVGRCARTRCTVWVATLRCRPVPAAAAAASPLPLSWVCGTPGARVKAPREAPALHVLTALSSHSMLVVSFRRRCCSTWPRSRLQRHWTCPCGHELRVARRSSLARRAQRVRLTLSRERHSSAAALRRAATQTSMITRSRLRLATPQPTWLRGWQSCGEMLRCGARAAQATLLAGLNGTVKVLYTLRLPRRVRCCAMHRG